MKTNLVETFAAFQRERQAVADRLEAARQEREALATAPLPRADVLAKLEAYVDAQRQRFDSNLSAALAAIVRKPDLELDAIEHGFPLFTMMHGKAMVDERLLVAVLADGLKARLREALETMDWPQAGLSQTRRAAARAKLDTEIAELERELTEFDQAADAAGVRT